MSNQINWIWYRFKTDSEDWRPLIYNPSYPCWKSGEDMEGNSIIVAYLPDTELLTDYWPEAMDVDSEQRDEITFSSRFPMPEDYKPL